MSATSIDLGGGGNSFQFEEPGATVTGRVIAMENVQSNDMKTGLPAVWENGQPKMMFRVELATDLKEDETDDGHRSVYLKGSRKPESESSLAAVLAAVRKATGATALTAGGMLTLTYKGDGIPTTRGFTPPKLYAASYSPPVVDLSAPEPEPEF